VTSSLSQGRSCAKARRGRVADRQARAVGRDRIAVRHAHAAGRAVPGEDHVGVEIDRRKIDDLAVLGVFTVGVELQLLDHVGDPARAEAFPGQHRRAARAQHRPHRHLDGAGVRGRHDADPVVRGHAEDVARRLDRGLQLGLADGGAVRPAKPTKVPRST
jgi:hypothetical protein